MTLVIVAFAVIVVFMLSILAWRVAKIAIAGATLAGAALAVAMLTYGTADGAPDKRASSKHPTEDTLTQAGQRIERARKRIEDGLRAAEHRLEMFWNDSDSSRDLRRRLTRLLGDHGHNEVAAKFTDGAE